MKAKISSVLVALVFFLSCSPDLSDDAIPYTPFTEVFVNLNLPQNFILQSDGNYKYIGGGVKGIILYRVNANKFRAFERNCSYQPNAACATVEVHVSGLYMEDTCCGSVFSMAGLPQGGPAWRELRQYDAKVIGNEVIVTDAVIN